ncbi:MAG: TetR/AcrR family transcriptional regulator [Gammaproteobacteria bacterium]|nr:MAG: TetR/AcrR family transcriptional regulator [Gammaproteobacteria bacterium]
MAKASQISSPTHGLSNGARVILDAAKQLFAEKSFDAVSINQIAKQAGVSKANVFHHFISKDELYLAVLKAACEETVGSLVEAHSSNNAGQDLWTFFSSQLAAMLENRASARLILREAMESNDGREQALAEQVFAEYFSRLVGMVSEGQAQKLLRKDFDPALLAYLMFGANVFFFENHRVTAHLAEGGFARSPDRYGRDVFRLLLRGALADPESDFQFTEA